MPWRASLCRQWLDGEHCTAAGLELARIGLVFAAGEDIDLVGHEYLLEAGECEELAPLCFQQSTGNSPTPEFDIVPGRLRDLAVDEDVAHLDATAWLEDAVHLAQHSLLIRAESLATKFEERASAAKNAMSEDFAIAELMKEKDKFGTGMIEGGVANGRRIVSEE